MDIGMLWYDDDAKRPFAEKVTRAAEYYRSKYGSQPTECYVNPATLPDPAPGIVDGVRIKPNRTVVINHFWLGIGERKAVQA